MSNEKEETDESAENKGPVDDIVMPELYYLQDKRTYVGNDILWWAKGEGYTTNLRRAHIYTKEEAIRLHHCRETDVPWPKDYIDKKTRPAVDMQYVEIKEALKGTGIKLIKIKPPRKARYNCNNCGIFMSEEQIYTAPCQKCGADNGP